MAYDEVLAERIREHLEAEAGISEKKMFGGLAFLAGGHMAVAASGQGGLMVRADPEQVDEHLRTEGVEMAVMQGRPMAGWLRVADRAVAADAAFEHWVGVGLAYARSLPPKPAAKKR